LELLPEFPSVFDENGSKGQTLQATGTDDVGESVLPLGLPERGAPRGNSVHLSAVSGGKPDSENSNRQRNKKPENPT